MEELIIKKILESETIFNQNEIEFINQNNGFVSLLYLIGILDAVKILNNK